MVRNDNCPECEGFFFGDDSYNSLSYKESKKNILKALTTAMKFLKAGHIVKYETSW